MDTEKPEGAMSEGSWKDEFRLANFKLNHRNPELFVLSQCGHTLLYPIWTICWFLFHVSWIIYEIADSKEGGLWFIYLTNWGFICIFVMQSVDTAITIYVHLKRRDIINGECLNTTWFIKLLWIFFNVANAIAMVITLAYWTLLTPQTSARSVNKHALNYAFVILNVCFSAKPIRVYHMYQPVILSVIYLTFTGIYQAASGSIIYKVLDWSKPGSAIAVGLPIAIIGIPLSHLFFFALFKIRCTVSKLFCTTDGKKVVPLKKTESKQMFAHDVENSRSTPLSINTPTQMSFNTPSVTPEPSQKRTGNHLEPTPEET